MANSWHSLPIIHAIYGTVKQQNLDVSLRSSRQELEFVGIEMKKIRLVLLNLFKLKIIVEIEKESN